MSKFARRVDQLDAIYLDEELSNLLNVYYRASFKYLPNLIITKFNPELDILFKFLFKYLPLKFLKGSIGHNLFHLKYRNAKNFTSATEKEMVTLALSICLPWIWERIIKNNLFSSSSARLNIKAYDLVCHLEQKFIVVYQLLSLLNFCAFLQNSKFPSLTERFLKIRPLCSDPPELHPVIDENVRRELLWFGLAEFIGFFLPLINVHKINGFFKRAFLARSYKNPYQKQFVQYNECAICKDTPNFPYSIGCSHVFCYYCIGSIVSADPFYLCFDCDVKADGLASVKPLVSNQMI